MPWGGRVRAACRGAKCWRSGHDAQRYGVAVIGGGPGGSTVAASGPGGLSVGCSARTFARKIGESLVPATMLCSAVWARWAVA
jgi:hypothetical protein